MIKTKIKTRINEMWKDLSRDATNEPKKDKKASRVKKYFEVKKNLRTKGQMSNKFVCV